jgi:phosphate-selective porin OprO and OprP
MFHIYLRRANWLRGAVFFGVVVWGAEKACPQDATAASTADLQQRVQELEAVVRRLQDDRSAAPPPSALAPPSAAWDASTAAGTGERPAQFVQAVPSATVGNNAPADPAVPANSNFTGWNNGFFLQSPDRSSQLRITGQIQADYRSFFDPVATAANSTNSNVTGSPDTFLIRRARLGIEATMANYYEFRLLPDFAGTSVSKSIADAYLNVHYWDAFQVEVGKFKQPFSYEELIQDRYVPTMERSMMDQLTPQRDEGAMIHGQRVFGGRFDYAIAVSNGIPNDSTLDTNNDKDVNARVVLRPFYDCDADNVFRGLQVGIAGSFGVENDAVGSTTSTPATITTPATVAWFAYNIGAAANGVRHRLSPELVYFYRSLGFAGQYYHQDQQMQFTTHPIRNVGIDGYYCMATWLMTGEERHEYSQQIEPLCPFDPTAPLASPGAWELVVRVDRMEVGAPAFAGGANALASNTGTTNRSTNACYETTAGVNWYLNKWVRAQLNWEHANFASPVQLGNMTKALSGDDALYTRFQVIF